MGATQVEIRIANLTDKTSRILKNIQLFGWMDNVSTCRGKQAAGIEASPPGSSKPTRKFMRDIGPSGTEV